MIKLPPSPSGSTPLNFRPPFPGNQEEKKAKQTVTPFRQYMLQSFSPTDPASLRSCNVNRLRASQEVVCRVNWSDSSCVQERAELRQAVWQRRGEKERERCGGMRTNDCPATAAPSYTIGTSSTDQPQLRDIFTAWLPT